MHPNQTLLENFYAAFARLDADAMAACYAPDAQFDDEVFSLRGREQVSGMWRMLCNATRAKGLDAWKLECSGIEADAGAGRAHWDAHYRFSATGRMVLNRIDARFTFNDQGLIATHRDRFDFWAWSRQALGMPGVLLGWTPLLRRQFRAQAAANLEKYLAQRTSAR
ncbi:MAG: nuclear transport factor 2 family protein [Polaromonas sp.]|nr:nuclear transport factor 2 family protein [Polaromonas sp.]